MLKKGLAYIRNQKQLLNLSVYGFGQGFNLITPLLAVPYIVSKCGVDNYGKIGIGLAISFFVIVIIDFGSDIIGVKEVSINRENPKALERIFVTTYAAKFLLMCALLLVLSILFLTLPYFVAEKTLFFLSLPILIGQFLNPIWFFQGIEEFTWITILNVSSKVLYLAGVFLFIKSTGDYRFVNLCWGVGMILPFALGVVKCIRTYHFSFSSLKMAHVREFIREDYKFCISQLFLSLKNYSPIMLIGFVGGYSFAGQYKIIEQIIMPFRTYLQVVFRFFYPRLCYEIFNDKAKGIAYWKKINFVNLLIIVSLLSVIFIFSKEILSFFKVGHAELPRLTSILKYALLIPLFITLSYTLEQLLFSIGKKEIYIRITITTVIINFIMMYLLFKNFELYGLISSLLITETLVICLYSFILKIFFRQITFENGANTI